MKTIIFLITIAGMIKLRRSMNVKKVGIVKSLIRIVKNAI
jgi:hypothetical protein